MAATGARQPTPRSHKAAHRRTSPALGELVELLYPETKTKALAEVLGMATKKLYKLAAARGIRKAAGMRASEMGAERTTQGNYLVRKCTNDPDYNKRFVFAHVLAWEEHHGMPKPAGHVVVFIDGDKRNFAEQNLYCLPKSELLAWMRFVSAPLEIHVDRLIRRIMALDTSEAVQKKLLDQLDKLLDPDQKVDLHRARLVCETVQTAVNLLKVEIDYLRAIEGDGQIAFLETPHTVKARKRKGLPRDPMLGGPPEDHPWRGLGSRQSN